MSSRDPGLRSAKALRSLARAGLAGLLVTLASGAGGLLPALAPRAHAQDYRYNPANKVDPFLPLQLRRPTIRGLSRLQDYEIAELELVGTVLGSEITALILTPAPPEGILAKIGDRVGRKGGRIIAISRDKVVVREPAVGTLVPGRTQKFNDVTMVLAPRTSAQHAGGIQSNREAERMGFPTLEPANPIEMPPEPQGTDGSPKREGQAPGRPQGNAPAPSGAPAF